MQTTLSEEEAKILMNETVDFLMKYNLASIALLFIEINRPIAPITGNLSIALAPVFRPLFNRLPLHQLGILIQEDKYSNELIEMIERKINEKKTNKK